jgi:paraquat-inducible protein B
MSKKANPTVIGLFFVASIALGIFAMLLFSSRSAFHPKKKLILYFDGSLKGLNPGAPVKYRGVTVGSVVDILIRHNQALNDHSMPVIISVDKKLMQSKSDQQLQFTEERFRQLVALGYRGRLDTESFVTGVLYIEMDVVPDAPPPSYHQLKPEFLEIPTVPSNVQQLLANLAHFDIPGISEKLNLLLGRFAQLDMAAINSGVTNLLGSANRLVTSPDLSNSLASLKVALTEATTLLNRVDNRVDPLADSANATLQDAQKTLGDLRVAIQSVSDLLGPDAGIPSDLRQALQELAHASRSIGDLAEFLERNPSTLLRQQKRPKEMPP